MSKERTDGFRDSACLYLGAAFALWGLNPGGIAVMQQLLREIIKYASSLSTFWEA
jgi:hypothetical protein